MERSAQKTRLQRWAVVDTWEASHPDLEYWEVFLSSALGKEKKKKKERFFKKQPTYRHSECGIRLWQVPRPAMKEVTTLLRKKHWIVIV